MKLYKYPLFYEYIFVAFRTDVKLVFSPRFTSAVGKLRRSILRLAAEKAVSWLFNN